MTAALSTVSLQYAATETFVFWLQLVFTRISPDIIHTKELDTLLVLEYSSLPSVYDDCWVVKFVMVFPTDFY